MGQDWSFWSRQLSPCAHWLKYNDWGNVTLELWWWEVPACSMFSVLGWNAIQDVHGPNFWFFFHTVMNSCALDKITHMVEHWTEYWFNFSESCVVFTHGSSIAQLGERYTEALKVCDPGFWQWSLSFDDNILVSDLLENCCMLGFGWYIMARENQD